MANKQSLNVLQGHDGFTITASDSTNIAQDPGNTDLYEFCFVHNPSTGGEVKVTTAKGKDITVYISQGQIFPLAVKRVWATPAPPAGLVGIVGIK
jgi:hypothetical protein